MMDLLKQIDVNTLTVDETKALYALACSAATLETQRLKASFMLSTDAAKALALAKYRCCEREVFGVFFLNTAHQFLGCEDLFFGTIDAAMVYPREVVKMALQYNAAAVILFHNHPSWNTTPSNPDQLITKKLRDALGVVDIRVLDHLVVGGNSCSSFAELGLL